MPRLQRKNDSVDRLRAKELCERLASARKQAGLTQMVVARMLGCTQSYISKIEADGDIDFLHMERLAAIYDLPITHFLTLPADVRRREKYLGHTNEEWKHFARIGRWPMPRLWGRGAAKAYGSLAAYKKELSKIGVDKMRRRLSGR